jgi:hypothetical protein
MDEVMGTVRKVRHDKQYRELQTNPESLQRLEELERQISAPKKVATTWY